MMIRLRTVDGYIELDEYKAAHLLACWSYNVGASAIEHNGFMNRYYPLLEAVEELERKIAPGVFIPGQDGGSFSNPIGPHTNNGHHLKG